MSSSQAGKRSDMSDNDKPFACQEPGCGMKFANEDHLLVHKMKHQMSLTLTPGTGKLLTFGLADQTPTPTKFLKNCDEIGLFNDLATVPKNPFEEAFKAATDDIKGGKKTVLLNVEGMPLPGPSHHDNDVLNTPQPKFIFKREEARSPTPPPPAVTVTTDSRHDHQVATVITQPQPEYIPLPGPSGDMGSTLSPRLGEDTDGPSPAKRARDDSMASTGTVEVVVEESQELVIHEEVEEATDPHHVVPAAAASMASPPPPPQVGLASPMLHLPSPQHLASPGDPGLQYVSISPQPQVVVGSPPVAVAASPINVASSPVGTVVGQTLPAIIGGQLVKPAPQPQLLIQVMVQTPSGETVPVHIPAAVAQQHTQSVITVSTVQTPVSATSSPLVSSTTGGNASSATKQRLKAALQQQQAASTTPRAGATQDGNMRLMTEAVDRVTAAAAAAAAAKTPVKSSPQRPTTLTQVPAVATVGQQQQSLLNPALISQSQVVKSINQVEVIDADTSSNADSLSPGQMLLPGLGDDDSEERRQKFLERNRAAAARCRQKKKQWIHNLEGKAEELQATNNKLQTEISSLRNEVAQLKMLLLAHKDCPIMKQQQMAGQISLTKVEDNKTQVFVAKTLQPAASSVKTITRTKPSTGVTSSAEAIATSVLSSLATAPPTKPTSLATVVKREFKPLATTSLLATHEPINLKITNQPGS